MSDPSGQDHTRALCELLTCLLDSGRLGRLLEQHGVDASAVRRCIETWCKHRLGPPSKQRLREREGTPAHVGTATASPTELSDKMVAALADILRHAERELGPHRLPEAE